MNFRVFFQIQNCQKCQNCQFFNNLGRFNQYIHTHIRGQNGRPLGVITTEGQVWAQQRRFALKHLRDLGFGKKSLDSVMIEEADQLIDNLLARNPNGVVEIQGTFNIAIINVLWEIVASKRFDPDAQDTKIMMEMLNKQFKNGFSLRRFFPTFICHFLPFGEHELAILEMKEMMRDLIKEHLKNVDYDNPRDFMDVYLKEIQNDSNFEIGNVQLFHDSLCISITFSHRKTLNACFP